MTQIESDAVTVLEVLVNRGDELLDGPEIASLTDLPAPRINDAVALLSESGNVESYKTFGTAPFSFRVAKSTPRGRYELQRIRESMHLATRPLTGSTPTVELRPPAPIGSPYGFHDEDWELLARRKADGKTLHVVLGHQFESEYFDSVALRTNIRVMFQQALEKRNQEPGRAPAQLQFYVLAAGYGEHLFNEIVRDIISSDIAVFETSDHNPNVMLEMGVALTWGTRVLPIKREGRPKPPSDISGQTWADYQDNGAEFPDPDHQSKLVNMIDRALQKKG